MSVLNVGNIKMPIENYATNVFTLFKFTNQWTTYQPDSAAKDNTQGDYPKSQ